MALHTLVVAVTGVAASGMLVSLARRRAVADRLRSDVPGRLLPGIVRVPLARALDDAALAFTPEQACEVWLFAAGIAAVVGFGIAPAAGLMAGVGVLFGGPAGLRAARSRRARAIAAAVPETLEAVGSELRSGGTVAMALNAIARGESPLASDIARLETRVRLGASLPDSLHEWSRERPVPGVDATAGALALSSTVGGRAADSLDALASSLRDRIGIAAEARALSAQARYSAWVIGVAPVGYLACTAAIDPQSAHALIGTDAGRMCAALGVGLELLGALWMRAIIRSADSA